MSSAISSTLTRSPATRAIFPGSPASGTMSHTENIAQIVIAAATIRR
jgi:hypothetical protein